MSGIAAALALLIADPVILGADQVPLTGESEPQDIIQTRDDGHERMTVPVAVEGSGPYRFLIDTGSQRTIVSSALASNLKLAPGPTVRVIGIAGSDHVATAQVGQMAFGEQTLFGLTVPLLEDQHMGADGIVGTDSLQDRRVLLDFARDTIAIGDARTLGGNRGYEIVVRARRKSGQLIMTDAMIDGVRTNVVIDTGASVTVANRALQRALREKRFGQATLASVTGQTLVADVGFARELRIAGLNINNILLAFADTPAFAQLDLEKRPAIFLGMRELRAFNRVAIDFDTRRVMFDVEKSTPRIPPLDF
ncbi:retroviral-like aspartic protease family protein [Novosphingobium album (ex Liu et al. 2023)]|uniref:Retroviral-like aspartic protease family protein n=1 Tax=Novosphingobium album (ex Liu et al. 2023) TaxID=3031130 RepID=A0ABT5WSY4_9SPHN|nr:retroviral-like aspartic protease family protein [Novosphingobium album (ex Liu et al. 2023)]MDE8653161.1 retroviral-like aspartic protease family protein [Novosphingobium album (ex Liu et al. 2023)]